jgi:hypothetical protein
VALRRSSKGFGKAINKPMASAVRNVEVRSRQQMVAGQSYEGWLCKGKSCGLVIAIAPTPPGAKSAPAESDDRLVAIKCPHCGDEDLYHWAARGSHTFTPKETGTAA